MPNFGESSIAVVDAAAARSIGHIASAAAAAPSCFKPPPGLALPQPPTLTVAPAADKAELKRSPQECEEFPESEQFTSILRAAPLPGPLASDAGRMERLKTSVQDCIESIYSDRLAPTIGEIHSRLRVCGWPSAELRAVLLLCARAPGQYKLVPPAGGEPLRVLLRKPPHWFGGWLDADAADVFPFEIWEELKVVLGDASLVLKGGTSKAALTLRQRGLPPGLQSLTLGELRHLVKLALSPEKSLLVYDALHGGRLLPRPEAIKPSPTCLPGDGALTADASADKKAAIGEPAVCFDDRKHRGKRSGTQKPPDQDQEPHGFPGVAVQSKQHSPSDGCASQKVPAMQPQAASLGQMLEKPQEDPRPSQQPENALLQSIAVELQYRLVSLQRCILSFCFEWVVPTLGQVQERLLHFGWSPAAVQSAPLLCARHPELFVITGPAKGEPVRVQLRSRAGFFDAKVQSFLKPESLLSKEALDSIVEALQRQGYPGAAELRRGEPRDADQQVAAEQGPVVAHEACSLQEEGQRLCCRPAARAHAAREAGRGQKIFSQI